MKKAADLRVHRRLQSLDLLACGGVAFVGAGPANAAARLRRLLGVVGTRTDRFAVAVVTGNCRRQNRIIDPLAVIVVARTAIIVATTVAVAGGAAVGTVAARFGPIAIATVNIRSITARFSAVIGWARAASALRLLVGPGALGLIFAVTIEIAVAVAVIVHVGIHPVVVVTDTLLFVEPRPGIAQHAEIMIRELKIIFGLDAVAGLLGVARHALVFLMQLGGIAALAIILAIAAIIVAGHALGLLSTATATAATLTIIDQAKFPRRTGASAPQNHSLEGQSSNPSAVLRANCAGAPVSLCAHDRMRFTQPISSGVAVGSCAMLSASGPVAGNRCRAFPRIIQAISTNGLNQ